MYADDFDGLIPAHLTVTVGDQKWRRHLGAYVIGWECCPLLEPTQIGYIANYESFGRKLSDLKQNSWLFADSDARHNGLFMYVQVDGAERRGTTPGVRTRPY